MDTPEIIKKIIEDLLSIIGFSGEVQVQTRQDSTIVANVTTPEAGLLIGPGGESLLAFQHLVRLLVRSRVAEPAIFVVDVNNYRLHRISLLEDMARSLAEQAKTERRALELSPMTAFERRIIHLVVKEMPGVASESEGEGERRHVVVKPISPTG